MARLTQEQKTVLIDLIREKLPQAEIAKRLNISQPTVSYYVRKLGLSTRKPRTQHVIPTENFPME